MNTAMNTNVSNQVFDWNRFIAALRKEIVENKRQLLLGLLAMFLLFTIIMVLANIITNQFFSSSYYNSEDSNILTEILPATFISSVYTIVVAVAASLAFRNLTSKAGRVALFTTPASNVEKFVVNLLVYVIGVAIAFFVCIQLADLARIAVLGLFESKTFHVPGPMNFISALINSSDTIMSITGNGLGNAMNFKVLTALSLVFGPAIYFMGSVLWPRWALVKSFACQQVISILLNAIVFAILYGYISKVMFDLDDDSKMNALTNYTVISTYISFAISAACWVAAWFLFKRKDVVSLKWWS